MELYSFAEEKSGQSTPTESQKDQVWKEPSELESGRRFKAESRGTDRTPM